MGDQRKVRAPVHHRDSSSKKAPQPASPQHDSPQTHNKIANPELLTPEDILRLQRTYGNAAVQRMIARAPDSGDGVIQRRKVIDEDVLVTGKLMAYELTSTGDVNGKDVKSSSTVQAAHVYSRRDITTKQWLNAGQGVNSSGPVYGTNIRRGRSQTQEEQ